MRHLTTSYTKSASVGAAARRQKPHARFRRALWGVLVVEVEIEVVEVAFHAALLCPFFDRAAGLQR